MSEAIFQLGQKAFIVNERNEVLMVGSESYDDPTKLWWDLPGGRVDENEDDLSVALDRELQEELGIDIDVHELLTLTIALKGSDVKPRVLLAIYHCTIRTGEPTPSNEVKDFKWVNIDSVTGMPKSRYSNETIAHIKGRLDLN